MKPYIDFNTNKRKDAKGEFEKSFYKLMSNSVFGKSMENVRKRKNIHLVTEEIRLNKLISKPGYMGSKIFDENLAAIHSVKERLTLNKPINVCWVLYFRIIKMVNV